MVMLGSPGGTEFVGRARELMCLTGSFEGVRAGRADDPWAHVYGHLSS